MESMGSIVFFGTSALMAAALSYTKQVRTAKVTEIWIYPIKICKGIKMAKALVGKRGFEFDRLFMFVDKENNFISQRSHPKMALIECSINDECTFITISGPDGKDPLQINLSIPISSDKVPITCTVWGDECSADVVPLAGEWLCNYLQVSETGFRLVRMAGTFRSI